MEFGMPSLIELETIEENAALCQELHLNFVELNMNLPICQIDVLADAKKLLEIQNKYGIYFTLHLDENLGIADFNECISNAYMETVKNTLCNAVNLNISTITMHMSKGVWFTLPDDKVYLFEKYKDIYLEKIVKFKNMCTAEIGDRDICICIENTSGFSNYEKDAIECMLESPAFGLTFDIGHSHEANDIDESFILAHKSKLQHFHIHDAIEEKNHMQLGTGEIKIAERLALAQENNCRCVIEVKTIEALNKSVEWINRLDI